MALLEGVIMAINGTNPGPASGITYKIAVDTDGGDVVLDNMVPWGSRFPDDLQTVAAPVGTPIAVSDRAGNYRLLPPANHFRLKFARNPRHENTLLSNHRHIDRGRCELRNRPDTRRRA